MARLQVIHGPDRGKAFELPAGTPQLLGRSSEAIASSDRSMSRRHAELTPELDGGWAVRDLASRFGTYVDGDRVHGPCRLRAGDRIQCGATVYRLEEGGPGGEAAGMLEPPSNGGASSGSGTDPGPGGFAPQAEDAVPALAHSIKNILQGLRGGTDTVEIALARGDLDLARRGWPLVARNLDRIYALSLNLLALARPRPLDRTQVALGEVVREVLALAEGAARRRGVALDAAVQGGMPETWLDPAAIHHALLNLVLNAIEACPAATGRVVATVERGADGADGSHSVEIAVTDNGAGVSPSIAGSLFEPFVSSKGQRGSGLGLAVSRQIARAHGGDVTWDRAHEPGTRMVLRVPAGRPASDPDETSGPFPIDPASLDARFR